MPAKHPAQLEELTMSEIESALELSSLDPDAPHSPKTRSALGHLHRCAVAGVQTGLEWGGPVPRAHTNQPESALEVGSASHAGFDH